MDTKLKEAGINVNNPPADTKRTLADQLKKKKPKFDILAGMKEWIIEYPTEIELKTLYKEHVLWKQYKSKVIDDVRKMITNKRSKGMAEQKKVLKSDEIVHKVRNAK